MAKGKKTFDFEKKLAELEALARALEAGELGLEQSLEAFEQGIRLTRECQAALEDAEQKVQLLLNDQGDTAAFGGAEDTGSE